MKAERKARGLIYRLKHADDNDRAALEVLVLYFTDVNTPEVGAKVIAVPAHLGKVEDIDSLFEKVKSDVGKLDVLVNNVGMNIFTPAVTDADESLWDKIIDTNLKSVFLVSQRGARMMREAMTGSRLTLDSVDNPNRVVKPRRYPKATPAPDSNRAKAK